MAVDFTPIPLDEFKAFDQQVILDIMNGSDVRYAQRFFDRFSHIYRWILENEVDADEYLYELYREEHIITARRKILKYVEGDPLEDSKATI